MGRLGTLWLGVQCNADDVPWGGGMRRWWKGMIKNIFTWLYRGQENVPIH